MSQQTTSELTPVNVTPFALAFALNGCLTPAPTDIARACNLLHIAQCEDARRTHSPMPAMLDLPFATHAARGL